MLRKSELNGKRGIQLKKKIKLMTVIIVIMLMQRNVYALTAGGTSPGTYVTQGGCRYSDRESATVLVNRFLNTLEIYADATIKFNYKNQNSWEQDMKPGAWNNNSIDDVEFMIYAGHRLAKGALGLSNNALHFYTLNSTSKFHEYERQPAANLTTKEAE